MGIDEYEGKDFRGVGERTYGALVMGGLIWDEAGKTTVENHILGDMSNERGDWRREYAMSLSPLAR